MITYFDTSKNIFVLKCWYFLTDHRNLIYIDCVIIIIIETIYIASRHSNSGGKK